jgi:hypothetical protein
VLYRLQYIYGRVEYYEWLLGFLMYVGNNNNNSYSYNNNNIISMISKDSLAIMVVIL